MQSEKSSPAFSKQIKIVSTVLIFGAIALWIWQLFTPLPPFLQPVFSVVQVVMLIHAVEGAIAAVLVFRYRQRTQGNDLPNQPSSLLTDHLPESTPLAILKGGLYAFFVGTIGLAEVIEASKLIEQQN
ncbi:MAG: hypothetical protein WA885_20795 [Phormidesmis sp.]